LRFASVKADDENRVRALALAARLQTLHHASTELVQYLDTNNLQAFLDQPTQAFLDANLTESQKFVRFVDISRRTLLTSIEARFVSFKAVSIVILLILAGATLAPRFGIRHGLVRPLEEARRHFQRISQGRLNEPIAASGTNEIGQLFLGLAQMQSSVTHMVKTVRDAADAIYMRAAEVEVGNSDLSRRSTGPARRVYGHHARPTPERSPCCARLLRHGSSRIARRRTPPDTSVQAVAATIRVLR
jgi:methyl-accepting chemotaxis protein I, serine sensor receptor